MKTTIILLLVAVLSTSCSTAHVATLEELKGTANYQMSYDAMRRGSILSISDGKINKILSEVQPDAAIAKTTDITSKLMGELSSGEKVSAEQITKIAESLSKLGERTAPVNMLRDALYRMEEHCINFPDKCQGDVYWKSFDNVVNNITTLQNEIATTAKNEADKAVAEEKRINTYRELTPEEKKSMT